MILCREGRVPTVVQSKPKTKRMDYELTLDLKQQAIRVKVICLLNQEIRKEILAAVADQARKSGFSKVLVDVTKSTFDPAEPMVNALDLIRYMRSLGLPADVKLAFIYADSERHRKYFESVAQMEGFNIRYFKDGKEAEEWLK